MTNENRVLQWAMVVALFAIAGSTLVLVAVVGGAL